jgi:hypothetical protein
MGQTLRSRSRGQKVWYQEKGLAIRNTNLKYECAITCHLKDMANVNVYEKWVKWQGHQVQNYGTKSEVLS